MAVHFSKTGRNIRSRVRPHRSSTKSPYDVVTNRIIEALEAGVVPWRKPWHENTALPCNAVSHRPYHGINLFLLSMSRYTDHRWLTYRQAEALGGHVRPGEQSSIAVFWKQWEPAKDEDVERTRKRESIPLLRYYHLFNAEQCEGIGLPALQATTRHQHQRIESAEAFVKSLPDPPIFHKGREHACYYPLLDIVQMPPLEFFETPDSYYATLFHELGHWTGHEHRLNRSGVTAGPRFGSSDYSREELIAELTSAYCCAELGLDNSLIDNAASYMHGWLTILRADAKAVITASSHAQRAANYLHGVSGNERELEQDVSVGHVEVKP